LLASLVGKLGCRWAASGAPAGKQCYITQVGKQTLICGLMLRLLCQRCCRGRATALCCGAPSPFKPSAPEILTRGNDVLEPSSAHYTLSEEIGRGSYGVVFEASRGSGLYVAKRFKHGDSAAEDGQRACLQIMQPVRPHHHHRFPQYPSTPSHVTEPPPHHPPSPTPHNHTAPHHLTRHQPPSPVRWCGARWGEVVGWVLVWWVLRGGCDGARE
jgi:hypothetical protein